MNGAGVALAADGLNRLLHLVEREMMGGKLVQRVFA